MINIIRVLRGDGSYGGSGWGSVMFRRRKFLEVCLPFTNFDCYGNYRGSVSINASAKSRPETSERTEGAREPRRTFPQNSSERRRHAGRCRPRCFCLSSSRRGLSSAGELQLPDLAHSCILARTRVNAIISLEPSARALQPSLGGTRSTCPGCSTLGCSRDKYLYRAHPLRHCDIRARLGYSCSD